MNFKRNIPYFIFLFLLLFTLKIFFKYADTSQLIFLLKPTNEFVELLVGTQSQFTDTGYYFPSLKMVIDKSCSGFTLWLITFTILSFLALKYFKTKIFKIISLFLSLFIAFITTIFINSARIYSTIAFQDKISSIVNINSKLTHEAIGISINLTFLIAIYLIAERILNKKKHAKFS